MSRDPEIAAPGSSGGFSNVFGRPVYQMDAVTTFFQRLGGQYSGSTSALATVTQPVLIYPRSATSRGFPDVSAQAIDFWIIRDDSTMSVS